MTYDVYKNLSVKDLEELRKNKEGYGRATTDEERAQYNQQNRDIRWRNGIMEDQDIPLYTLNDYITQANRQRERDKLLTKITSHSVSEAEDMGNQLQNFTYNPNNDPAYQIYRDAYQRESNSAQKQTINNLNSANMGRNSSYSAAAAAQVAQTYSQKLAEVIPQLEDRAFDRLYQQYTITKDREDTDFNRSLSMYNALAADEQLSLANRASRITNDANALSLKYLPDQLLLDIESGKIANDIARQNLSQAELTTLIMQKYGMSSAEAEYTALLLANEYQKLKNANFNSGTYVNNSSPISSQNADELEYMLIKDNDGNSYLSNNYITDDKGNISSYSVSGKMYTTGEILSGLKNGTMYQDENGYVHLSG